MPTLISGTPTNLEELRAIGEKAIAEGKEVVDIQNKGGNTIEEPKESKEIEEPVVEVEEELKSFKFYDADTNETHKIIEGVHADIPTKITVGIVIKDIHGGTWHIDYDGEIASFSLEYGFWSSLWCPEIIKASSFDNKKMPVKPNSRITSEDVKRGAIEEQTPPSLTQVAFGGSKTAETTTVVLIGLLLVILLLRK